jgi:hypothetical protein
MKASEHFLNVTIWFVNGKAQNCPTTDKITINRETGTIQVYQASLGGDTPNIFKQDEVKQIRLEPRQVRYK